MVVLQTIEEWQRQTALLLQARPTTARIITKYNIANLDSPKYQRKRKRAGDAGDNDATAAPKTPRALLILRTYDPESGACLIFKTDKAADVGRLVGGLGRLGRHMAALPQKTEDVAIEDAPLVVDKPVSDHAIPPETGSAGVDSKLQPPAASAGGKKKKKGKK